MLPGLALHVSQQELRIRFASAQQGDSLPSLDFGWDSESSTHSAFWEMCGGLTCPFVVPVSPVQASDGLKTTFLGIHPQGSQLPCLKNAA